MLLFCLFIAAIGVAGFLFWRGQAHIKSEAEQLSAADVSARDATRSLLEARASQQAYVAAGQGLDYWAGKTRTALRCGPNRDRDAARLDVVAAGAHRRSSCESTIDDLGRIEKRALEYVRNNQRLLASDLVFTDGLELNDAALASLEQARNAEALARQNVIDTSGSDRRSRSSPRAAASTLTALLLLPAGRRES